MPFIIQLLNRQGHLVDQIFCKDVHESLKYVDEFFELKMMKFKKDTHLSLSLYLSIDRKYAKCHLVDQIFCKDVHESLKYVDEFFELKMTKFKKNTHLSLSLYLSIDRKYAKCRIKADAHDKMCFQYISISVDIVRSHARIQRRDRGSRHPNLKNHKI